MKRIALFLVLIATFVSAATAEPFVTGKPARIFVSVQLNDGQTSFPISSLTIANGDTGTVYIENGLPYIERMEKSRRAKGDDTGTSPDGEEGLTMLLTPTLTSDGQIDIEILIRKSVQAESNGDAPQMADTEVRHKVVVRSGQHSTIQLDPAPVLNASAPAATSSSGYSVTLVAQKI